MKDAYPVKLTSMRRRAIAAAAGLLLAAPVVAGCSQESHLGKQEVVSDSLRDLAQSAANIQAVHRISLEDGKMHTVYSVKPHYLHDKDGHELAGPQWKNGLEPGYAAFQKRGKYITVTLGRITTAGPDFDVQTVQYWTHKDGDVAGVASFDYSREFAADGNDSDVHYRPHGDNANNEDLKNGMLERAIQDAQGAVNTFSVAPYPIHY